MYLSAVEAFWESFWGLIYDTMSSAIKKFDFFLSNLNPLDLLLFSYCYSQNLKTWRDMERVDSLVLFLILVELLWVSCHLIWCWLLTCILLLLYLYLFLLFLIYLRPLSWKGVVKCFFMSEIGLLFSFLVESLCGFDISVTVASQKVWQCSFCFYYAEHFEECGY